jgi:protein-disulfide isomerase
MTVMITRRQLAMGATAAVALGAVGVFWAVNGRDIAVGTAAAQLLSASELEAKGPLDDIVTGSSQAPVTIIEYASMTCPHCAHFAIDTFPKLKEKYIDTGKVRYILREFPLNPPAAAASMAIRCAGPENYYPLTEKLFAEQQQWAVEDNFLGRLYDSVKHTGMSEEKFKECLNDRDLIAKLQDSRDRAGKRFKVNATPTFFINGQKISGALSIEELDTAIEPHLPK